MSVLRLCCVLYAGEFFEAFYFSSRQWMHRFLSFGLLEHAQLALIYCMTILNNSRARDEDEKRKHKKYVLHA